MRSIHWARDRPWTRPRLSPTRPLQWPVVIRPSPTLATRPASRRAVSTDLRVGYVPLLHAAPLLIARDLGFFASRGIRVRLSVEVGWATIREKILSGELDAA